MAEFIHLRTHSAYSLLEGAIKVKDLIKLAHDHKMPAVAITDTNNLFGCLEFSLSASGGGIQPIIACQLNIDHGLTPKNGEKVLDQILLYAKNRTGYENLIKLLSVAYLEAPSGEDPHITQKQLEEPGRTEGLIALSGGYLGGVGRFLLEKNHTTAEKLFKSLKTLFPENFYVEISRHGLPEEAKTEEKFISLAYKHDVPLVATNHVFFAEENMFEAHDALLCVAEGKYIVDQNRRHVTPHHRFKSVDEMKALFEDLPEAIQNTVVIAKRCSYVPQIVSPILPPFATDSGHTEEEELAHQAKEGLIKRLESQVFPLGGDKEEIQKKYLDRLEHELKIINKMGYPGYFLIVADFIKWAKEKEIPVGPGRGSGAGSLVAWSLTITDIDPIRFGLLFERFLNPERVSMPDFDVDFCQERRDEVISYVQDRYGKDHVAQIITFGTLQARAVLRDVGRVLQMPYGQVDRICKLVPSNPANPVTLKEALDSEVQLQEAQNSEEAVKKLMGMAMKLEGLYRHASTHAAGVVIGDRPLEKLVPLYRDPRSTMPVTQFSMKYVELAGLVKFDFLGLKTLTVMAKTVEFLKKRDIDVNISTIPLEDKKTFDLLKNVDTTGVFQLESAGMRDVVRKLQPDRFEEIIALVALYRPGPMDDIPRYIACKHGEEEVVYPHPMLENILRETFGVMVYQEQVMQIAQVMAGYSLGEADLLRRAMGKKIKKEMDAQRKIFIEGSVKNGVDGKKADQIFDQIAKFAGYGFNKSHSAPYGLLAYQTAYLKANYPVEFVAALMTLDITNTDKLNIYRQELDHMEIPLLPPDINKSEANFSVEKVGDGYGVRYAFAALKNVGEAAMEAIVAERSRKGPYKNLEDFAKRLPAKTLNKRQFEQLISAGTFDSLNSNRRQIFNHIDVLLKLASSESEQRASNQKSLFGGIEEKRQMITFENVEDWPSLERLRHEFDAIGFYLTAHPLEAYQQEFDAMGLITSRELMEAEDGAKRLAGIVLVIQERTSKNGNRFAFVQFSDPRGVFEVTMFSEILGRLRSFLQPGSPFVVDVSVRRDGENVRLTCSNAEPLEEALSGKREIITLYLKSEAQILSLKKVLEKEKKGASQIKLILETPHKPIEIILPETYSLSLEARAKLSTYKQEQAA